MLLQQTRSLNLSNVEKVRGSVLWIIARIVWTQLEYEFRVDGLIHGGTRPIYVPPSMILCAQFRTLLLIIAAL
jgi:hypothetical protein